MRLRRFVLWSPSPPDALCRRLERGLADGDLVGTVHGRTFRLQRSMSRSRRRNPFALTLAGRVDQDPEGSAITIDVRMSLWLPLMVADLLVLAALLPVVLGPGIGLCFAAFFGPIGLGLGLGAAWELRRIRRRWMALVDPTERFVLINEEARPAAIDGAP